jgi:hypothetical protein
MTETLKSNSLTCTYFSQNRITHVCAHPTPTQQHISAMRIGLSHKETEYDISKEFHGRNIKSSLGHNRRQRKGVQNSNLTRIFRALKVTLYPNHTKLQIPSLHLYRPPPPAAQNKKEKEEEGGGGYGDPRCLNLLWTRRRRTTTASQPASKRKIRSTRTHDSADHSSDSTIVENILSTDFIG